LPGPAASAIVGSAIAVKIMAAIVIFLEGHYVFQ
jgi:hypothetical protein